VIVYKRTGGAIAWTPARDRWLHDLLAGQPTTCEPEWVGAEHPLFLLYTSARPASPRACSTAPAATCCMRR
jgi:acetyl-CoA synthetase